MRTRKVFLIQTVASGFGCLWVWQMSILGSCSHKQSCKALTDPPHDLPLEIYLSIHTSVLPGCFWLLTQSPGLWLSVPLLSPGGLLEKFMLTIISDPPRIMCIVLSLVGMQLAPNTTIALSPAHSNQTRKIVVSSGCDTKLGVL